MDEKGGMKSGQQNRKINACKMGSALLTYPYNISSVYFNPMHVLRNNSVLSARFTTINLIRVKTSHLVRNQTSQYKEYNPLNQTCKSSQCTCGMHWLRLKKATLFVSLVFCVSPCSFNLLSGGGPSYIPGYKLR